MRNNALIVPITLLGLLGALAVADDARTAAATSDEVPLQASDLREITAQVLDANPELASSPGVKFAEAYRSARSDDGAFVIFYPHTDTGGIKQALQVGCSRSGSDQPWTCEAAEVRRYLRVESQAFEVRVTGDIGSAEAFAVVEATRASLPLDFEGGPADSCKAILLRPTNIGYKLQWSCNGRDKALFMHATAIAGADTTQTSGWQVSEYILPQLH
jgi:hypothetical protein